MKQAQEAQSRNEIEVGPAVPVQILVSFGRQVGGRAGLAFWGPVGARGRLPRDQAAYLDMLGAIELLDGAALTQGEYEAELPAALDYFEHMGTSPRKLRALERAAKLTGHAVSTNGGKVA